MGDSGIQSIERCRITLEDRDDYVAARVASERHATAHQLVQDHAERPDVRARVHLLAPRLLGRHVVNVPITMPGSVFTSVRVASSAGKPSGAAWRGRNRGPSRGCPAGTITFSGFRSRCTIPRVRGARAGGNLNRDVQRGLQVGRARLQQVAESLPLDVLHRDERLPLGGLVEGVDDAHVGMAEAEAARASCSNRRIRAWSEHTSPDSTLIATLRPSVRSWARYTVPMPPAPSWRRIS